MVDEEDVGVVVSVIAASGHDSEAVVVAPAVVVAVLVVSSFIRSKSTNSSALAMPGR